MSKEIYRLCQVRKAVGLSRSEIYRRIAAGSFPRPFPLGLNARAVGWDSEEIDAWIDQCIAQRNSHPKRDVIDVENLGSRQPAGVIRGGK